jgi:hypothetical protein
VFSVQSSVQIPSTLCLDIEARSMSFEAAAGLCM